MKIAFIGGRNIHKLGGIETYMLNLATKLIDYGYEPIVYCESDCNKVEYVNGFKVIHWKSPKSVFVCKIFLGFKSTLHAVFKEKGVKVIHYNAWPPSLSRFFAFGRKTIMMGHGLEWKRTKYSDRQKKIMKFMEKITALLNPNLLMCSQEQTDFFAKEYGRKCVTMPTAVNMPIEASIKSDVLERFNLKKDGYFLYLGRLVQDKNPDYLIKAFIESKIKDFKLVIAGANDAMPEYVEHLHNLAEGNNNIIFTGAVYGDDKESLLQNCLAFCIPSTIEGLAITLLEAMSYGKPVIASDIEANHEGLADNGLWVKAEDVNSLKKQLLFAANHIDEIKANGKKNKDRIIKYFTWDIIAKQYSEYIKSLFS